MEGDVIEFVDEQNRGSGVLNYKSQLAYQIGAIAYLANNVASTGWDKYKLTCLKNSIFILDVMSSPYFTDSYEEKRNSILDNIEEIDISDRDNRPEYFSELMTWLSELLKMLKALDLLMEENATMMAYTKEKRAKKGGSGANDNYYDFTDD